MKVRDIDRVLSKVEKLGGKIVRQKRRIKGIGQVAIREDTEENGIGLWKPEMEK